MKRSQLVFVSVVFTAVATGFVLERQRQEDPFAGVSITAPGAVELPPVVLPPSADLLVGSVTDAAGLAQEGVGVHLVRPLDEELLDGEATADERGAEPLPWARTGPDGRFRIEGAPPGRFHVRLIAHGRVTTLEEVTLPHAGEVLWRLPERSAAPNALAQIETSDAAGRIAPPIGTLPEPYPVGGYEVWFEPVGEEQAWLAGRVPRRLQADASGVFVAPGLVAGSYLVRVLPEWASGGTWPVLETLSYSHPGPAERPPSLALRLRAGTLSGRLIDQEGEPILGALVMVWPEGEPGRIWPPRATDADGAFLVRDLPPGAYRVRVRAGGAEAETTTQVRIGARAQVVIAPLVLEGGSAAGSEDDD